MIAQILQRFIRADQQGFWEQGYFFRVVRKGVDRDAGEILLAELQRVLGAIPHLKIQSNRWSIQSESSQAVGCAGFGLGDAGSRELLQNSLQRGFVGSGLKRRGNLPGAVLFFEVDRLR